MNYRYVRIVIDFRLNNIEKRAELRFNICGNQAENQANKIYEYCVTPNICIRHSCK